MHIAVCDDNVADRKQLERLLKREADRRLKSSDEVLYTDSFGNAQALLANPMQYDAFYIDMCRTEGITAMDIVSSLVSKGVHAPVVMCCSEVNYREYSFPDNVFFLDKPIKVPDLTASVDHALEIKSQAPSLIELREEKETTYVTEPQIAYGVEEGGHIFITLTDGRKLNIACDAMNFFTQVEAHPSFFLPTPKILVNGRHIQSLGFRKITMTDGTVFRVSGKCMDYAKYAYREFHSE